MSTMTGIVRGAAVGTTGRIQPGETIPPALLREGVCLTFGTAENFYRIRRVVPGGVELSHLRKREVVTKTLSELIGLLPIVYIIPDRPWRSLRSLKEGGLYQVWPTGDLLKVSRGGILVDAVTNQRLFGEAQRHRVPTLFPVLIERWVPPTGRRAAEEEEEE